MGGVSNIVRKVSNHGRKVSILGRKVSNHGRKVSILERIVTFLEGRFHVLGEKFKSWGFISWEPIIILCNKITCHARSKLFSFV